MGFRNFCALFCFLISALSHSYGAARCSSNSPFIGKNTDSALNPTSPTSVLLRRTPEKGDIVWLKKMKGPFQVTDVDSNTHKVNLHSLLDETINYEVDQNKLFYEKYALQLEHFNKIITSGGIVYRVVATDENNRIYALKQKKISTAHRILKKLKIINNEISPFDLNVSLILEYEDYKHLLISELNVQPSDARTQIKCLSFD